MSITDPTIDPVTGLPVLDTSGIVQQIPLGRQIVDYPGWFAAAQPTRTPLSPDDGIPVFANVQGQHPQTGNAQNVTTDGEGRLNVHTFPSGSGGGGPTPAPYLMPAGPAMMKNVGSGTTFFKFHTIIAPAKYLMGWVWQLRCNPIDDASAHNINVYIYATDGPGNPIGNAQQVWYEVTDAFSNSDYPWKRDIYINTMLPQPLDIAGTWPGWVHLYLEGSVQVYPALSSGWLIVR